MSSIDDIYVMGMFLVFCIHSIVFFFAGEAILPLDVGILDNFRVKRQLLHSWLAL